MKPIFTLEKTTTPSESLHTEARGNRSGQKVVFMVVGMLAFVLVVSTVVLSVCFGMKMAKNNYKEYHATYVADDGAIIYEKVIVTSTEEVFSNGMATGIADFSTGLITIKMKKAEFPVDECYVTNLNASDFQTPKEFTRTHTSSQFTFETKAKVVRKYDVTDVWLNNKALGQRSAELCTGNVVYFLLEKTDLTTREKRDGVYYFVNMGENGLQIARGKR